MLLAAAAFSTHAEVAGQTVGQSPVQATGPRLEASAINRPPWTQLPAQPITVLEEYDPTGRRSLLIDHERGPSLSKRGALIGAALGCTLGAVGLYDPATEQVSQRLAWSAGGCIVLAFPGAWLGALLIP